MNDGLDKGREAFREEAGELLAELEISLLELEENPTDTELVGRLFRAMHTIKGSGAMFGFDDIAEFTHEIETTFDMVRNGDIAVTKHLIDLTLKARDQIRAMLEASAGGPPVDKAKSAEIVELYKKLNSGAKPEEETAKHKEEQKESCQEGLVTYRVRIHPARDLFTTGTNPLLLLRELSQLGSAVTVAQTRDIPELSQMDPESCYTYWDIVLTTDKGVDAINDVFIFVDDSCEVKIEVIDDEKEPDAIDGYKRIGEILTEKGDVTPNKLQDVLGGQKKVGQILVDSGAVDPDKVEAALAEQKRVREIREQRHKSESMSSIRVPSDKLDSLVDLVGELVTVQARLSQVSASLSEPVLNSIAEEVERLTWELRDSTMSIRMLPIGSTFSKFKRLVRDLSGSLGKEVAMTTDGAETELDKTVIERLNDPLVHIIRNSIDHGIEVPDLRVAAGKPREGTVHLSALHSGANVLIKIQDDGAGLDAQAILRKGRERGLVAPEAELSDKEIFGLIFEPGFSTAATVSSVSGRGVGMDVVKRNIDALRGSVDVQSRKGTGTTITLKLPLTLAIIDGLLVKIGSEFFVLPLSVVEECVELTRQDIEKSHGRHIANVRHEIIPYVRLREYFCIDGEVPEIEQIVITEVDEHRVGFVVDYVIGEHQTVIKTLGRVYKSIEGLSGATILGDGTVALILDVPRLVYNVHREEAARV